MVTGFFVWFHLVRYIQCFTFKGTTTDKKSQKQARENDEDEKPQLCERSEIYHANRKSGKSSERKKLNWFFFHNCLCCRFPSFLVQLHWLRNRTGWLSRIELFSYQIILRFHTRTLAQKPLDTSFCGTDKFYDEIGILSSSARLYSQLISRYLEQYAQYSNTEFWRRRTM